MGQPNINDRKKKHHLFCLNFKEYVHAFVREHRLIDPDRLMAISISGGVDSLALADVLSSLGVRFELIHFNHGTRPLENEKEEELVRKFGEKLGAKVNIFHFDLSLDENNFEKRARLERQKIYQQFIKKNYWVYTAHHIDDSFEWSLMQSFKQSSVKSTLGIPVFNQSIVRPFMCVTKKQIKRYARARGIVWIEDTSNKNEKFERNFLRLNITNQILEKYPQSLKHYVSRSNQLSLMQNLHRQNAFFKNSQLQIIKEESGGILMISKNLKEHKNEIKNCFYQFSNKDRGEIDQELDKLIKSQVEMLKDSKNFPFKGPMNFSGGVAAFLIKNQLFIGNHQQINFYKDLDLKMKTYLENLTQIPNQVLFIPFPQLAISFRKKLNKSSKFIHPLLPVTCLWLKNQGISYGFTPLMSATDRQMLTNDAVILDSSRMGL